jgi:hypothetical protein
MFVTRGSKNSLFLCLWFSFQLGLWSMIYILDLSKSFNECRGRASFIILSCRLAMEHLCVLQLETALATLVTTWFTLVDRRWRSRYRSSDQCHVCGSQYVNSLFLCLWFSFQLGLWSMIYILDLSKSFNECRGRASFS